MLNQNQNSVNPSDVHLVNYRAIIADTNISLTMIDDCIKDFDGAAIVVDRSPAALENDAAAFEAFAVELDKISRARKDSVYRYRQTVRKLGYYMTARGLITTDKAQTVIKSMDAQLERGDETTARLEVKRGAQQYAELLRRNAQDTRCDAINVDKSTQPETTPAAPVVETVEETAVEENNVEEIDDNNETGDDETNEEKERALELVAVSTVERLRASVVAWRHLSSDLDTAPRSWDRLRPYSLNNTLIIESTPETSGARLLITLDRADVKEDGENAIDWAQYDNTGADVWQPRKFKFIPIKDDAGNIIKDDDGKILATRKVSKYGKVTIHDADLFPWLAKKREQKYAQLEKIIASEIKERDAKRAALLGAAPEKWASNLAQIVKRFFDGTKLTSERSALGQEIARAFIASRLGFDLAWNADAEKTDAARLLALCTQGDKKHDTVGHALQVVLKHVNKCVASILYQSQPTAIKPREEKPAPAPTAEEVETENTLDPRNYDAEEIADAIQTLEHLAIVADTMDGRDVEANERRDAQEKTARKLVEEARENETVNASQLDSYEKDIDRINAEYPPKRVEDGLIIRRNSDGSESWLSKNGTELMRDVTNAH